MCKLQVILLHLDVCCFNRYDFSKAICKQCKATTYLSVVSHFPMVNLTTDVTPFQPDFHGERDISFLHFISLLQFLSFLQSLSLSRSFSFLQLLSLLQVFSLPKFFHLIQFLSIHQFLSLLESFSHLQFLEQVFDLALFNSIFLIKYGIEKVG